MKQALQNPTKSAAGTWFPPSRLLQRCGDHACPPGGCEPSKRKQLQRAADSNSHAGHGHDFGQIGVGPFQVTRPNDATEREADEVASRVADGSNAPPRLLSADAAGPVHREEKEKEKPKGPEAGDVAEKIGKALMEVKEVKELKDKILEDPGGQVLVGKVAADAIAAVFAANEELPFQPPEIPLTFLKPGLSVKIVYEGKAQAPTNASITFIYTGEPAKKEEPNPYGAETKKVRESLEMWKPTSQKEKEKREQEALVESYVKMRMKEGPLGLPSTKHKKKKRKKDEMQGSPATTWMMFKRSDTRRPEPGAGAQVEQALSGPGRPLDPADRAVMEARFGHDFRHVRIHDDPLATRSARAVEASAYTVGRHIVFAEPFPRPAGREARRLLAHELTHSIQQGASKRVSPAQESAAAQKAPAGTASDGPLVARRPSAASDGRSTPPGKPIAARNKGAPRGGRVAATTWALGFAGPGRPLDLDLRRQVEQEFGHDFTHVRIHDDYRAAEATKALGARAYTVGQHVAFAPGAYAPASSAGRRLIRHEMAHVVQQAPFSGGIATAGTLSVSHPGDAAEREADAISQSTPVPIRAPRESSPLGPDQEHHAGRGPPGRAHLHSGPPLGSPHGIRMGNSLLVQRGDDLCGGSQTCAHGDACEEPDPGYTGRGEESTEWSLQANIDIEEDSWEEALGLRFGFDRSPRLGHTYVTFRENNGRKYTYGFYPENETPNETRRHVPGCVRHPDTTHDSCIDDRLTYALTRSQYEKALRAAQGVCRSSHPYGQSYTCTTYVRDVVMAGGQSIPSAKSKPTTIFSQHIPAIDNPNTLYENVQAERAKRFPFWNNPCANRCESDFKRCTRQSRSGGMACLAQRNVCNDRCRPRDPQATGGR